MQVTQEVGAEDYDQVQKMFRSRSIKEQGISVIRPCTHRILFGPVLISTT